MERGRGQEASGDIDWRGRRWRKKGERRRRKKVGRMREREGGVMGKGRSPLPDSGGKNFHGF